MAAPKITPLPTPPNRQSAAGEFSERADEFLGALPVFGDQMNAVASFVDGVAQIADTVEPNAIAAQAAAQTAQSAAAAVGASAGLPAIAGKARRPLAVNSGATGVEYADLISMASYIDRTVRNADASGNVSLNVSQASVFDLSLAVNTTLATSGVPVLSGETLSIVVRIRQGATARTLNWWPGITWLAPSAPGQLAAGKIAEFVLSYDGTDWIGREGGRS